MENSSDFKGERLRLARQLKGLTLKELGEQASVSRQFIHQLEAGVRKPAQDVLLILCETLGVLPGFFFSGSGNEVKVDQCHFRKRMTTSDSQQNRIAAYSTIFEDLISFLSDYLVFPRSNFPSVPQLSDPISPNEIEQAAEECRKLWNLGIDAPIKSITRVLEKAGVFITQFSDVSDKVDALSIKRRFPIIIRNAEKGNSCRNRFDLAHECGHFVLHDGIVTGDYESERQADCFASALIFPRSAFVKEFPRIPGRFDWESILSLKKRWGMSVRAIVFRAHYLGLISAQQYRTANIWLSKSGQTRTEIDDDKVPTEKPEVLENGINLLANKRGISPHTIADKLGITIDLLSQIVGMSFPETPYPKNVIPILW